MFATIKSWFVGEVHTVESALASFTTAVKNLEAAAVQHAKDAIAHNIIVTKFEQLAQDARDAKHEAEDKAAKAYVIASKINELITVA